MIERLRIMHDLAVAENFSTIPRDELLSDLNETLAKLDQDFRALIG